MPSEARFALVRKALEQHGWTLERTKGSHHRFTKPGEQPITVAVTNGRWVKPVYVREIEKQLGIKI